MSFSPNIRGINWRPTGLNVSIGPRYRLPFAIPDSFSLSPHNNTKEDAHGFDLRSEALRVLIVPQILELAHIYRMPS